MSISASAPVRAPHLPAPPAYVLPIVREHCLHTKQYCEENVYQLAKQLLRRLPEESKDEAEQATAAVPSSSSASAAAPSASAQSGSPAAPILPAESLFKELDGEQLFVVFISNVRSEVVLWRQSAGDPTNDGLVCWDYHVVLMAKPPPSQLASMCTCGKASLSPSSKLKAAIAAASPEAALRASCPCSAWVYDLDTTLPFPCPLSLYAREAFRAHLALPKAPLAKQRCTRLFRVVGAKAFLLDFASDRSHMLLPAELVTAAEAQSQTEGAAGPPGVGHDDSGVSRAQVEAERRAREAEEASWSATSVGDRLARAKEKQQASRLPDLAQPQRLWLAPPPPYPPIQTALCKNNLDDYRYFRSPDSGKGAVMSQEELLDFMHVEL